VGVARLPFLRAFLLWVVGLETWFALIGLIEYHNPPEAGAGKIKPNPNGTGWTQLVTAIQTPTSSPASQVLCCFVGDGGSRSRVIIENPAQNRVIR
jgi:hypothetical protein